MTALLVRQMQSNRVASHGLNSSRAEWLPGDEISDMCRITLAPGEQHLYGEAIDGPGAYEVSWRRSVYIIVVGL